MKDRIIKFLTNEGLTATKFADEIGVQRSSISHILSGRNNPSFEFIQKIINRYRNINVEWLLQGTGSMYKKPENTLNTVPVNPIPPNPPADNPLNQLNLFQPKNNPVQSSAESDKSPLPKEENKIEPSRKVEKILLFYSDKTFDEFSPSK
jgi:transcriptional regulator with XRE-family HTH domain